MQKNTLSVTELNSKVRNLLELHLPMVWVEGEISNFSRPSSGHWYFTLKDEKAQIRCAMFRGRNTHVRKPPQNGDRILARARVSLYEGRGDYQLIVEHMEEAGFGYLQQRFEALKQQLHNEGLFDPAIKKPVPSAAKHVALISSSSGAAIRDVFAVFSRRFPATEITLIPSMVQGEAAPATLIQALHLAQAYTPAFDVILLCRGGGSLEDLWAFNDEQLARAIHACKLPVVSAIGHEVDFTIADFVADLRAPTPSAAAELLSPDQQEVQARLQNLSWQLETSIRQKLRHHRERVHHLSRQLKHPQDTLNQWSQRLDQLEVRIQLAISRRLETAKERLQNRDSALYRNSPSRHLAPNRHYIQQLQERMKMAIERILERRRSSFIAATASLDLVSPIATLARGYTVAVSERSGVIRSVAQVNPGEKIRVTLQDGEILATVDDCQLSKP